MRRVFLLHSGCGTPLKSVAPAIGLASSAGATSSAFCSQLSCVLPAQPGWPKTGNSDYTNDLPSVDSRQVREIKKARSPTDTLARQVAVFNYLYQYVDNIKYARTVRGPYTPGEQRTMTAYRNTSYQISQDYAKTHTSDEAKAFERLHGQYER